MKTHLNEFIMFYLLIMEFDIKDFLDTAN